MAANCRARTIMMVAKGVMVVVPVATTEIKESERQREQGKEGESSMST